MAPGLLSRVARWFTGKRESRPRSIYGAASTGRLAEDWAASILSADAEMRGALSTMRARARQLVRDNAHAAGFVHALVDGVLGPQGIGIRPRVRLEDGELDDEANAAIWESFTSWMHREHCSADGQSDFAEFQRLMLRTWAIDGEVLVRRGFGARNPFGYDVQLIDADLLDETHNVPPSEQQNEIRMGVEVDPRGRPIAYHLFRRHPVDLHARGRERVRVPAAEILHLFLPLRPGQTRGVPPLAPVMLTLKLIDEFTIATLMQARIAASAGGFFETDANAYTPAQDAPDGTDRAKALVMDLEPGVTRQLPPGLKFSPWSPTHPTDVFEPFQKVLLRMVARGSGSGVSYATLTGDLSEANYSSDRAGRLAERDAWRGMQCWLADRTLRFIWGDFVRFGLLSGALRLGSLDVERFSAHDFEFRGWPWVDPLKDINAAGEELALHLTSPQRVCAERGRDFETILEEWAEAKRLAEKHGIELTPAASRDLTTLQDPAPPAKPPARPPSRALRLSGGRAP